MNGRATRKKPRTKVSEFRPDLYLRRCDLQRRRQENLFGKHFCGAEQRPEQEERIKLDDPFLHHPR